MSKHTDDMQKIYASNRAFDEAKPKSYYPFGHAKPLFVANKQYRDNFDRIFGKGAPSNVTESDTNGGS